MTVTAEQLLQHSQWAETLARQLVGDAAEADDLVQDAWIAAMQDAPPEGALRPWLGGVIRNLAKMGRRTAGRRKARERVASKAEALPSAGELVERAEVQRNLADAVLSLSEPYRSVVILRYIENYTSAEIARDRGIPPGTVRSQLHEGLAKLRVMLDRKYGGHRDTWCVTLLPLARADIIATGGLSAPALKGLVLMKATKTTAVVAAAAIFAALIFWIVPMLTTDPGASPGEVIRPEAVVDRPDADAAEGQRIPDTPIAQRQEIQSDDAAAMVAYEVRVRFVDADRRPIPGVHFVIDGLSPNIGSHLSISDAQGIAKLTLRIAPPSDYYSDPNSVPKLRVRGRTSRPGLANKILNGVATESEVLDFGDVELGDGGTIHGKVLFASGQPAMHAKVTAIGGSTGLARVTTGESGEFRLEGVRAGTVRVHARVDELFYGTSDPIQVHSGRETPEVIVRVRSKVAKEDLIQGVVLDSAGKPVPQGGVRTFRKGYSRHGPSATANALGLFSTQARSRGAHQAIAFDPDNRWRVDFDPELMPGTFKKFRLREPGQMRIVVSDPQGRAVPGAHVNVYQADQPWHVFSLGDRIRIDGNKQIPMPPIPFRVIVGAEGYRNKSLGPFDPDSMRETIPTIRCQLTPALLVRGIVHAKGTPVPGAKVRLHRPASQRRTMLGFPISVEPRAMTQATTDAQGRYKIWLEQRVPFRVLVTAKGYALADSGVLPPSKIGDAVGVRITLWEGGIIEGRILERSGEPNKRPIVAISRGDGAIHSQRVDAHGHYRFAHLTAGRWLVRKVNKHFMPMLANSKTLPGIPYSETPWNCQVFEGRTTTFNLGIHPPAPCTFMGSLHLGQMALDGGRVELSPLEGNGDKDLHTVIGSNGSFKLRATTQGRYRLRIGVKSSRCFLLLETIVKLTPGHNEWRFDRETAPVTIKAVTIKTTQENKKPSQRTALRWHRDGVTVISPVRRNRDGPYTIPMPQGKLDLVQDLSKTPKPLSTWPVLESFTLTESLTIPVPK